MKNKTQQTYWDHFLRSLANYLQDPSDALHSVRVVSDTTLKRICREVSGTADFPAGWNPTGPQLVRHLVDSGLAKELPLEPTDKSRGQTCIYSLGFAGEEPSPDPVEVLQAAEPKGVSCYFTAIDFFELTTQIPAQHHVAIPKKYQSPVALEPVLGNSGRSGKIQERMGTLMFTYDGVPYYRTQRDLRLLPGIQKRRCGDSIIHVTSLEQTLLDTLHHPKCCGGAAVVFEAWERGWEVIDQDRMALYLRQIPHDPLRRRVGCMMDTLGFHPEGELKAELEVIRNNVHADTPVVSLLKGIDSRELNTDWQVRY